ncbi:protein-lysine N-methyltransferase EEF2KMT [Coccinella septempunctata]|uniref:protein-lysine N-methyltransferase EEF2KMT n=1 Tax=Coccinella septempunctata TaxID=41139 RepID=UPI001D0694CB|nr:protein-lysine N-methyltransferase EEF2KMT [Coccinella septempunctata]
MFILELSSTKELNPLIVDFFRKKHTKEIVWKKELASSDVQSELVSKTVDSKLVIKYKIEIMYQRRFLRKLMNYLDDLGAPVGEAIYEAFCRLSSGVEEKFYHVFYPIFEIDKLESLSELNTVILKENVNIISQGTTGLITWQASQALAEWALKTSIEKKTILELGSGTGMAGLVVASSTSCGRYIFTDCHSDVLSLLTENVELNCDKPLEKVEPEKDLLFSGSIENCKVEIRKLDWDTSGVDDCEEIGSVDLIFASDVVYDKDLFEPLTKTIKLFLQNGTTAAIIAFTQRDESTVNSFREHLESMDLNIKWLETPKPNYLSWQILPIIHIIEVTL